MNESKEFLEAGEAIKYLSPYLSSASFYRLVKEGKINKYYPTSVSKHGLYDAKEIARLKSKYLREDKEKLTGETDWVNTSLDMGSIYDLEYSLYGPSTGDPGIIRRWYEYHPNLCRVLYNKDDRRDLWGTINLVPLREETIFKLLHNEIRDADLVPETDILLFDQPGQLDFYVSSVILRPERRQHFNLLINSLFNFWCAQAPTRTIRRIYGKALSEDGEMLVRKLFFSPLLHIGDNVYMLDVTKPNPSRIIQSFQYCIKMRGDENV